MREAIKQLIVSKEIKIGDLLTTATILISLISVLVSWNLDRRIRSTKDADIIREAAAKTLGDLEHWRNVLLSVFDEAQPVFIEVSELAADKSGPSQLKIVAARDLLWKKLNELNNVAQRKILDERLDDGYVRILSFYPEMRKIYQEAAGGMREIDRATIEDLLGETERAVLKFQESPERLQSAQVGNALRKVNLEVRSRCIAGIQSKLLDSEKFLINLIEADDVHVLAKRR